MLNHNPNSSEYYDSGIWSKVTLDNLLRKCVQEHPEEIALIDPSDRQEWACGVPKLYAWKHLNSAVDTLTSVFSQWKLPAHSAVVVQLPNIAEHVITFFALLRCNYIPVFVEPIAGRFELQTAARLSNAHAIISYSQLADLSPALAARDAAVDVLSIRIVAAFGKDCPDGVTSLDALIAQHTLVPPRPILSAPENLPAHGMCANIDNHTQLIWRSHNHCIASGLMVFLDSRADMQETLICCTPILSPCGLSAAIVPWLLSHGKLQLLHPFNDLSLRIALKKSSVKRLIISGSQFPNIERYIPAHLAPEHLTLVWSQATDFVKQTQGAYYSSRNLILSITDVVNLNDLAICAIKRTDERPTPLSLGAHHAPRMLSNAPIFLTLHEDNHQLMCSGAVVAQIAGEKNTPVLALKCTINAQNEIIALEQTGRTATIGGLRVGLHEIEAAFAHHPMVQTVHAKAVPDELFGERIQLLVSGKTKNINSELILTLVEKHLHETGFSTYKSASEVVIMPSMHGVANFENSHVLDKAI